MHFSLSPESFVLSLQEYPSEILTIGLLLSCAVVILLMMRLFGKEGLMVYSSLAVVIANLQVQKAADYLFFNDPISLGTVVFSSVFIVSSVLTEYYGKAQAQKTVWLSFTAMILITFFMLLTMGFKPAEGFEGCHQAMCTLFMPAPALIAASLLAYAIGQFNEIWIFATLSKLTTGKFLWFRTFTATMIGAFLDSFIFGTLAWIVFAPIPLPWNTVFYTFILGAYVIRVIVAVLGIPFVYLARIMVK
jgi:queuosine precursor transporter